ncbi:hypothetical protein K8Z61_06555 [Nocardioides sp. TRM66260-LWL]|uniref:hypothetical protein n=1 Tax=Nocardioides sp. TRM66260-LWL TaxID=2874478 RepID=UPI001CC4BF05|nr:hypothetical protein [Nocardioides sp. TRM66260-LWL]MBZ5734152.1 hypothetical protein [Nocardioides sp. TRM66260-LWL]
MEILLWLVPPVVVTAAAAAWVAVLERRGPAGGRLDRLDRDERARRLGVALERSPRRPYAAPPRAEDRSTGVAVRPSRRAGVDQRRAS